VRYGKVSD